MDPTLEPRQLSVLIAAHNEEDTIEGVIQTHLDVLRDFVAHHGFDWELVVLDDGSSDQTGEIVKQTLISMPNCRTISSPKPSGVAAAFRKLVLESKYSHFYLTSGDGQFPAEAFARVLNTWLEDGGLVVGERTNRSEIYGFRRRIVSRGYRIAAAFLIGFDPRDPGSVKLVPRHVYPTDPICRSTMIEVELLARAQAKRVPLHFVDIPFKSRISGNETGASIANVIGNIKDLARLKKHLPRSRTDDGR